MFALSAQSRGQTKESCFTRTVDCWGRVTNVILLSSVALGFAPVTPDTSPQTPTVAAASQFSSSPLCLIPCFANYKLLTLRKVVYEWIISIEDDWCSFLSIFSLQNRYWMKEQHLLCLQTNPPNTSLASSCQSSSAVTAVSAQLINNSWTLQLLSPQQLSALIFQCLTLWSEKLHLL